MKRGTWSFYGDAVRTAVESIVLNLDVPPDFEELAREAALSPFHFHRIFRGMVGETPLQLHRRLRLERAAWTLLHDDASVTRIAFAAGYDAHEAFTRAFSASYGCSPSEFRAGGRNGDRDDTAGLRTELPARSGLHFAPGLGASPEIHAAEGTGEMPVYIEQLPELHLAAVRHVGPYHGVGQAFRQLLSRLALSRVLRPDTMMMVIYHDDPEITPEAALRADAAITVPADTKLAEGLQSGRLAAGRYARAVHLGSYTGLGDAWARFMGEWLPASGERVGDGVPFEVYRNDPAQVPEAKLRTDLFLPLA